MKFNLKFRKQNERLYRFIILFEFNKNIIVFQELFILKEKKQSVSHYSDY